MFSLEMLLRHENFTEEEIISVLEDKYPFFKAKYLAERSLFNYSPIDYEIIYHSEQNRILNLIKIAVIGDAKPIGIIEYFFLYAVLYVADKLSWKMSTQNISYPWQAKEFLQYLSSGTATFDLEAASCFAWAHQKSKMTLNEIVTYGLSHILMNSKSVGTPVGNIVLGLGKENLFPIITRLFKNTYEKNTFSLTTLLLSKYRSYSKLSTEDFKFDIQQMSHYRLGYSFPPQYQPIVMQDIKILNDILLPFKLQISTELDFDITHCNDSNLYTHTVLNYFPYTNTGKPKKYPYELRFSTITSQDDNTLIYGDIFYFADGNIGKANLSNGKKKVQIRQKNKQLYITRIDVMNDYKMINIYKH